MIVLDTNVISELMRRAPDPKVMVRRSPQPSAGVFANTLTQAEIFCPDIAAARQARGQPIRQIDAQIAAIVRSRGARLVTRNVRDAADCGISIADPWVGARSVPGCRCDAAPSWHGTHGDPRMRIVLTAVDALRGDGGQQGQPVRD